jgi:hypothetical protein
LFQIQTHSIKITVRNFLRQGVLNLGYTVHERFQNSEILGKLV